ncbi:MAG: ABC transporter ATP-binding protein [Erysipelothrix sp.]|nr:ABC transporter ATP-binding protein [Erysipelothrix sp.]
MNHLKQTDEKITLSRTQQWQLLKRLVAYVKDMKWTLIISIAFLLVATTTDLVRPAIIKSLIDDYVLSGQSDMTMIVYLSFAYLSISLVSSIFRYLYVYNFYALGNRITQTIRHQLFEKLQGMGMRYFDKTPAGSIVSRVTNDTDSIQEMLVSVISVVFSSSIMVVSVLIAMFIFNPILALISMFFVPIAGLVVFVYQKKSTRSYQRARSKLSELNTKLAESIAGMSIIQVFNQQKRLIGEFKQTNDDYYDARMANLKLDGILLYPIIHLLTALTIGAILLYFGVQSFDTIVSAGLVLMFVDYVYMLYDPLFMIMDRLAIFQQAIVSSSRVFTIMDHEEITPQQTPQEDAVISEAKIEFKDVSFSYDGRNKVLKNISFTVNPGETLALVGHTGSGKSSIINVMMRFYEFYEGDILIDGHSIRDFTLEHLREKMSLVLQDPFIYYGTILDNVRLLDESITDEEVIEALKFVQADTFIEELSDTYHHQVVERGAAFSSGQKQLLAFARTLVTNPKILILDEATANIDTETESLIQDGLTRLTRGRTTIAIAHRLSTIKDANQILVLSQGEIVERGNHDELIAAQGLYYHMYELQQLNN